MGAAILYAESEIASRFRERLRTLAPKLNEEAAKRSTLALRSSNPFVSR